MDLREASLGFYRVWFAATGARNGLLRTRWTPVADLARGMDEETVVRYLRGAQALGLVEERGGRYRLRPEHARTLGDPASSHDLSMHFQYLARKSLGFGALDDLLRGKAPGADLDGVYALATTWDHIAFFERVLPREPETRALLRAGCDVLDLGAGLGAWSREARRRFPRARVVMAEVRTHPLVRPLGLDVTRPIAPREGMIAVDAIPEGAFDVVFLGEVLSAARDPLAPLATAHRALRPGGVAHALEGLLSRGASRTWGARLVRAMDFDFALDGSRFLRVDEAEAALRDAGFVRRRVRDVGGSLYHLRGRKRQTRRSR